MKEINVTKTQLIVTTGKILFQYRMPRNLKLCAQVSYSVEKDYADN